MISGIFFFALRFANSAICWMSGLPSSNASSINWPDAPKQIAQHTAELHVGVFQNFLHPILLTRRQLNHLLPPSGQIAQLPNHPRRNETGPDHSVPQQVGQPPTVLAVGLMTLPRLD